MRVGMSKLEGESPTFSSHYAKDRKGYRNASASVGEQGHDGDVQHMMAYSGAQY